MLPPKVSVPPVMLSTLVALAAALEAAARLIPLVIVVEPPEMLTVAWLTLPVPVLAELFTFMFNVPMVTVPPVILTKACTGAADWAVAPPPMELTPTAAIPVMATVPPPMFSVAIAGPLVAALVLVF